jgi:hypothetical protein
LLGLTLANIFAAAMFAFPTVTWSQTDEWTVYNTANSGLPYNGVTALAFDAQGNAWIGTGKWNAWGGGGLAKFDGQNWTVYNTSNSALPNNDYTGLSIDPQGNVWSATEGGTLTKFDGESWTVYRPPTSSGQHAPPSFDAQGNLWVGSCGGGLAKFDGVNWTVYNTGNSGLPHNIAWPTAFDIQGNLWIGTFGGGLAKFDGANWTVYNTGNSGLPHNRVNGLAFDAQGSLWMGTGGGVAEFDGANWTVYNTANSGLPDNRVGGLAFDARGNLWILNGPGRAVSKFAGENWRVYNTSNSGLLDDSLYCLAIDAQGNIWIGTESVGVAVYYIGEQFPIVDFNGDGIVDIKDLLRLIESWGQDDPLVDIAPPPFGDGVVDVLDLELLMSYWEQPVDDPTLIAHWALDEMEGTVAYDSAGVNDAFVVGGTAWQPSGGQVDGALQFDGIDGCAIAGPVLNPADGPFSVFTWINGGASGQVIVSQQGATDWLKVDAEGNLMTDLKASGRSGNPLQSQSTITEDSWHRVGFVWDGFNRSLYIDDILVAEDTQQGLANSIGGLNIGCGFNSETGTFWSGMIDEVRIYNRTVSP